MKFWQKSNNGGRMVKKSYKNMANKKMKTGADKKSIVKTALEIAPLAIQLFDPEIASNPLSVVAKAGRAIATYFLAKFFSEYKTKVDECELKIKDFTTEKPALIFTDLLKIIDEAKIDEERFKAMKSVFYIAAEKDAPREQEEMAYRLFQITKQLSSEEVLILSANYNVVKGTSKPTAKGIEWGTAKEVNYWAQIIAEQIGHNIPEIILQYENHLVELKIISDRDYPGDRTRVVHRFLPTSHFRLTPLGYKLCEFITKYD